MVSDFEILFFEFEFSSPHDIKKTSADSKKKFRENKNIF